MLAALSAIAALLAGLLTARRRRRAPPAAHAVIISPRRSTVISRDANVRSVQSAELTLDADDLERLWVPANLENLARTYWRFLTRATLGLVRVVYDDDSRSVVLLGRPLVLLRFDKPDYTLESDHGGVRWRIRDGLLVSRSGHGSGYLAVDVRRRSPEVVDRDAGRARLRIEVEVANFYPSIATSFSIPVYEMTQSLIHVLVTHAYLRSLANLRLDPSRVGALATPAPSPAPAPADGR